jgi:phosphatidylglycerol---prolipoprotein diacylglyceryl transferase
LIEGLKEKNMAWTYPQIDPVAVAIGPLKVHWYGLMYLIGFGVAYWLGCLRAKRADTPLNNKDQVGDMIFYCALGVILGGRLGYVFFYNFDKFLGDPMWLFRVWEGGMAFHGGLLGVFTAMWLFARKVGTTFLHMIDYVGPLVPIALGLGRVGNFIGGELWGRATDVPWAMVFPSDPDQLLRHPSQLYQVFLEGILLFSIVWLYSNKQRPLGAVSGMFLIWYGLFRILVEFVREPDAHIGFIAWGWLTKGQLLSLPMVLAGIALMIYAYKVNGPKLGGHVKK